MTPEQATVKAKEIVREYGGLVGTLERVIAAALIEAHNAAVERCADMAEYCDDATTLLGLWVEQPKE